MEYNFKLNQPYLSHDLNLSRGSNSLNSASGQIYSYIKFILSVLQNSNFFAILFLFLGNRNRSPKRSFCFTRVQFSITGKRVNPTLFSIELKYFISEHKHNAFKREKLFTYNVTENFREITRIYKMSFWQFFNPKSH